MVEKDKSKFVHKSITITKNQENFIENKCLNLSRFVQKKLKEEIFNEIQRKNQ